MAIQDVVAVAIPVSDPGDELISRARVVPDATSPRSDQPSYRACARTLEMRTLGRRNCTQAMTSQLWLR